MKVIILSINTYKDKEAVINSICPTGQLTFIVKGLYDPKSRNAQLNAPMTIIDAEFVEGSYQFPVLKRFEMILQPMKNTEDYLYLSTILILGQLNNKILQPEDYAPMYEWLYNGLVTLENSKKYYDVMLIYTANVLRVSGYEFEVNRCVMCGTNKNIVAFSFSDGGFLCRNCLEEEEKKDLTPSQMLLIRAVFNAKTYDLSKIKYDLSDGKVLMFKFYEFINDMFGTSINNILMLNH